MQSYLGHLPIDTEIYRYNPQAHDDLYTQMRDWLLSEDLERISRVAGLRKDYLIRITQAMQRHDIVQLNQLGRVKGIGVRTLEKIFAASNQARHGRERKTHKPTQLKLFIGEESPLPDETKTPS